MRHNLHAMHHKSHATRHNSVKYRTHHSPQADETFFWLDFIAVSQHEPPPLEEAQAVDMLNEHAALVESAAELVLCCDVWSKMCVTMTNHQMCVK
jgi:hypothetical protein